MRSHVATLIAMTLLVVSGGGLAVLVRESESILLLTISASVGAHLIAAVSLLVLFSVICALKGLDPPPRAFFWSFLLVVVLPAALAVTLAFLWFWPRPESGITTALGWLGALATPFLVLGIGGMVVEVCCKKKDPGAPEE